MRYKLTEEAAAMKTHEFAINYGVNIKVAVKAFQIGEIDIDDKLIVDELIKNKMIESKESVKKIKEGK